MWESLIEGSPATFDPHQHATPILASSLAELLLLAYRRGLRGRYHIAGAERTSAYRFAMELAAAFGLRNADASTDEDPPPETERPHLFETSLATRRAQRELASPMPMLRRRVGLVCRPGRGRVPRPAAMRRFADGRYGGRRVMRRTRVAGGLVGFRVRGSGFRTCSFPSSSLGTAILEALLPCLRSRASPLCANMSETTAS